ncbi:hypothetical protein PR202_gb26566 [Eleusine coracana subsp. coracana]|uniref:Uncharacterized protein n=1 Tax=Eleusine coracana subsp. coracana TaxID=191504 RepID=A0AAV5FRV2_ELECO|nr:hypothetical protein PR202_gb26566 [Eleusine coracana subsp. coracana]
MAAAVASKQQQEEEMELRRGPWTLEEDNLLMNYIACHGEGRWNLLARCSGLKRTGKSCRLRWLNYLKPDIKRGNLTPEEQLLILELHSKWGNRWSRIAQHLPGRTDNEIKNYWRTRVQKQARQLRVDANSPVFRDAHDGYGYGFLLLLAAVHHHHGSLQSQLHDAHNNNAHQQAILSACYYHGRAVEPSPSTSTSGSGSGSTTLPPVPCFSELGWADQQQYYCDLPGGASFDSAALVGSLGLDGLDLGPGDGDYSDSTLLDYLNSTDSAATMTLGGSGNVNYNGCGGAMGDEEDYGSTWRAADELCQAAARKLGDHHQWGGGI